MTALAIVVGLFILLDVVALAFGTDSRDGDDWTDHHTAARA